MLMKHIGCMEHWLRLCQTVPTSESHVFLMLCSKCHDTFSISAQDSVAIGRPIGTGTSNKLPSVPQKANTTEYFSFRKILANQKPLSIVANLVAIMVKPLSMVAKLAASHDLDARVQEGSKHFKNHPLQRIIVW